MTTLFARQEIFNREGHVFAYELLYRSDDEVVSNVDNTNAEAGLKATSSVIAHLFAETDVQSILGDTPAFINFPRQHLLDKTPKLLPKDKIVIEILEDMMIDDALIEAIRALANEGYQIALDDFVYSPKLKPLVNLAHIIKIDVLALSQDEVAAQLEQLSFFKGKFLAEKIETKRDFEHFIAMGFDLFQGYFFTKPNPVIGKKISENKTSLLRLLAEIHGPDASLERVEELILHVPKLSYRILRLAHSAALFTGKKMNTLIEAIRCLGLTQIGGWVSLLMMCSLEDVPNSLIETTLVRAKMCEILAESRAVSGHQAFTIGILSTLDASLNEPLEALIQKLPLSDEITNALLYYEGPYGQLLLDVIHFETARFERIQQAPYPPTVLQKAYVQGISYSKRVAGFLH